MIAHVFFAFLLYAAAVFQAVGVEHVPIGVVTPNLPLLLVVLAVTTFSGPAGIVWAALAGLTSDCLATGPLGLDMLCATLVALPAQRRLREHPVRSAAGAGTLTFCIVLAILLVSETARAHLTGRPVPPLALVSAVAGIAAYSALIAVPVAGIGRLAATRQRSAGPLATNAPLASRG
ncbi:MAG: rod shape-determining protein MreD [Planctomycetes bacterium]|nr:rod shape-determining protein MreD [Planctomycetota bacterium]